MPPVEHLYIHIPFCPKLCPYCCFFVEEGARNKNHAFLKALLLELDAHMGAREVRPKTIYFGGGTPTALLVDQLEFLLCGLRERLPLDALEEWSVEANPATVRPEKARLLREAGVTRVSLGVQSWNERTLKTLGRVHSGKQALKTFDTLREAGLPQLNVDLMFSVPGQSLEEWEADLAQTLHLRPDHVSAYCLTYEHDTEYFRKLCTGAFVQNEELDARLFEITMDRLADGGYQHYEISNHALPGAESLHNQAYWEGREYIGLGPGAFSTLNGERITNLPDTAEYTRRLLAAESPTSSRETVSAETRFKERIAFGLRQQQGVEAALLAPWQADAEHLVEIGLLEHAGDRLRLTRRGKLLADSVAETFV